MKNISIISILLLLFMGSCMESLDVEVDHIPNSPLIKSVILEQMDTTGLVKASINHRNVVDTINLVDSVYVEEYGIDVAHLWAKVKLENGCEIIPLEEAPEFGKYGDFTEPAKYRVSAPSGNYADWTVVVIPKVSDVDLSCLSANWVGELSCSDGIYPSYSPSSCTAEKLNDDCNKLKVSFNFWDMGSLGLALELELGEIDPTTLQGSLTLLNDYNAVGGGYDITFHKGPAGTYDGTTVQLNLEMEFSGYNIGGDGKYRYTIK